MQRQFFDLTPFFIGLDAITENIEQFAGVDSKFPPYNIERISDKSVLITMAIAGFTKDELTVTTKDNTLIVKSLKEVDHGSSPDYIHHGIALRNFTRTFTLGEYHYVTGVELENGLLNISIEKEVPEHAKEKTFDINSK